MCPPKTFKKTVPNLYQCIMITIAFQLTGEQLVFLLQINIGDGSYNGDMCYINHNLAVSGLKSKIKVFDEETGSVLHEWKSCHIAICLMAFESDGKEYLLEGCTLCEVIRGYELTETTHNFKTFCENVIPDVMCKGPDSTILVLENNKSVKQLRFSEGKFHPGEFSFESNDVRDITFSGRHNIVLLLHQDKKNLTGIHIQTREVLLNSELQFHPLRRASEGIFNIFTLADGRVCIVTVLKTFVIDPRTGTVKYQLYSKSHSPEGLLWTIASCYNGNQQRLSAKSSFREMNHRISVFNIMPERFLPLYNITSK